MDPYEGLPLASGGGGMKATWFEGWWQREKLKHHRLRRPNKARIIQVEGDTEMSTPAGGTSGFQFQGLPAGSEFPAGTSFIWSVDDTADISLTPSGPNCSAACVASPAATSYNLTCVSNFTPPGGSAPIQATLNVPIVPAATPTPTSAQIVQTS
jgi:hypothetical protein